MTPKEMADSIALGIQERHGKRLDPRFIFAQMYHETGGFSSPLAREYHNYGGITQTAPNDLAQPDGSLYYRKFTSDEDYVNYMADYYNAYAPDGIFEATNTTEYANALKRGGYYGDTVENYAEGLNNGLQYYAQENGGDGNSVLDLIANASHTDSHGVPLAPVQNPTEEEQEEPGFWDKLTAPVMEAPLVKALRVSLLQGDNPSEDGYIFTKEDIDLVNREFNGDVASQNFIYSFAHSRQQLLELVAMQKESKELERRIAASSYGLNTAGSFIGTMVAEALNPLNYVGFGLINKGTVAAKMLKGAVFNAGLNVADASIRERLTGMKQDIATSAIIGAAVGAALPGIEHLIAKGASKEIREAAQQTQADLIRLNTEANAILDGKPLTRQQVLKRVQKHADVKYKSKIPQLQNLIDNQKAFVVPKSKLPVLSRLLNVSLPENARAFHTGDTTVFVKEVVDNIDEEAFDKLLLHEVGVHALPAEAKKPILDFVEQKLQKPKGLWREALDRATAATPKGERVDPEEVLGYWVELRGDNPHGGFLSDLTERINRALGRQTFTSADVLQIIKQNRDDLFAAKEAAEAGADIVKLSTEGDTAENYVTRLGKEPVPHKDQNFISKWFEGGGMFGGLFATPYGRLRHSKIKAAREAGERLYSDARMRGDSDVVMSAEDIREYFLEQVNVPYGQFLQKRRNYALRKYGEKAYLPQTVNKLDREIMLYHDYVYAKHNLPEDMLEVDDEIKELAKLLNDTEAKEIELAKQFGYIKDPAWENLDKGTRRVFNAEKWQDFINGYVGEGAITRAEKDLADYFYMAGYLKREENAALVQKKFEAEYADELFEYEKAAKDNPDLKPPVLKEVTDKDIDDFIREEARKTAKGYIDMDTSNFAKKSGGDGEMPWMRHRMHMDTSLKAVLNGREFSFDENLRSYDLQHILNRTTNRWAGEVGLHVAFQGRTTFRTFEDLQKSLKDNIENARQKIINEGKQRVLAGNATQSEVDTALKTFDEGVRELRGLPPENNYGRVSYIADILRNMTYSRVGGNMALNQKMDFGNAVGYVGFKALTSMIPYGRRKVQAMFFGKDFLKASEEEAAKLIGSDLRELNAVNLNLLNSQRGKYFSHGSTLDMLNNIVNVQSEITNTITGLGRLTARMVQDAKLFAYMDVVRYLNGHRSFGLFNSRNPFSKNKMRAAGIRDTAGFFKELKEFQKGNNKQISLDRLMSEKPELYFKLWKLVDNQAKRCVVEPTLGNKNILASSNSFWKILFQFKNFSFYATNSQTFRKLSNRDRDDLMSTIYELLMAAGVTYMGVQGAAWARYGNDKGKREQYIKKRMDDFYYGVATRSGTISSPVAFGIDALDAMGYMKSFRTTSGSSRYGTGGDIGDKVGRVVSQSPAFETLSLLGQNTYGYWDRGLTRKNLKDSVQLFVPANNWYPMATMLNEMIGQIDIPEK
ncbi:MAG: hypothetical protein DBY32_11245 [Phascolarctobacterium sp.]|nr:MAG: hypothetical protein DBY32_11245 [Phascolarctobacterium sp.]